MTVHASDATARVRCRVELNGYGGVFSPDAMRKAIEQCPRIGSRDFGSVLGAPTRSVSGGFPASFAIHDLRLATHVAQTIKSPEGQKHYVDLIYQSRPKPTLERGSSATQTKTGTYLFSGASGGNSFTERRQMVLDWVAKKGIYSIDPLPAGMVAEPPVATPYLRTPVSGSRMEFGASVRISSTYYADEITQSQIDQLAGMYTTAINFFPLFYVDQKNFNDSRLWICTAMGAVSHDGGWTNRVFGEFVFSPIGWDTIAVYNMPYSDQPAILEPAILKGIYTNPNNGQKVPPAYAPAGGGGGRFPQQPALSMQPLVGFLSQGILFESPKDVATLLSLNSSLS